MPMRIAGIGTAVPPHRINQPDAAEIAQRFSQGEADSKRLIRGLYRRSGVETRHSVLLETSEGALDLRQSFYNGTSPSTLDRMRRYEAEAGTLAVAAATSALGNAGIAADRVTHLVTVSCSGFYAPGFDITVIKQLSLDREVARTHVGFMGCHGALNGLRVAKAFLDADPEAGVLLVAVELCSLHLQYNPNSEKIVANSLFGDGAAALLGIGDGSGPAGPYHVAATGSTVIDHSEDAMSWRIGDHGFEMTLSPRVPELIGRHLRPWLEHWLERHGLTLAEVGSWAVHPGGPRVLSAFGEATGLDRRALETSSQVLAEFGNMSSPTILFILDRLQRSMAPRPCVALAFGPGLTVEAALLV
jgi:predicted naringenin-chalcone synthase